MKKQLPAIILSFVLGLVIMYLLKGCGGGSSTTSIDTVTTVDKKVDTVTNTITETKWETKHVYHRSTDTVVDTAYVYKDYYNYRWYKRSFSDSNFDATLKAGVWQNKLDSVEFEYDIYNETKTVTNTITKTKSYNYKLWLTGSVNFDRANIGAELDLGRHKVGAEYTILSRNSLSAGRKVWLTYGFRLLKN